MGLTRLALSRPVAILMLIGALVVLGMQGYTRMAVDRLPPTNFPNVSVVVSYPGASPRDIEQLIAIPIEKSVAGLRGVDVISSTSSLGSARVSISFTEATNLDQAAIDVEKRVNAIRNQLPTDASAPSVVKADQNAFPIMNVVMSGGGRYTTADLYDTATNLIQPALLQVDGVADVSVSGGRQREVQVQVDPVRLKAWDISLQQIVTSLSGENVNTPAGSVRIGDLQPNVRFTSQTQSVEDLKNVVINRGGAGGTGANGATTPPLYLKDVAAIVDTYADATRLQRFNGEEAIGITITKQPDANSIKVADDVKSALNRLQRSVPQGVTFKVANDTTRYTREALSDVQSDLELAVFITGTVLLLFLHSWRNTLIVLLAIPTSLISTFLVMYFLGFTLNLMSLMALALLIGILVDDSIVVLENIHRHLQLGETPWTAALKGRSEIGLAAMAITFLDIVVYLPIAFMSGNIGSLFRQFGLTIATATLFSLFISFTLTPMLASRWLKAHGEGGDEGILASLIGALMAIAAGLLLSERYLAQRFEGQVFVLPSWVAAAAKSVTGLAASVGIGGASAGAPGAPGAPGGFAGLPGAAAGGAGAAAAAQMLLPMPGLVAICLGLLLAPLGWWVLGRPIGFFLRNFPKWWEAGYNLLARFYGAVLPIILKLRLLVIVVGIAALAGTIMMVKYNVIGSEYAPAEDEGQITVNLRMPPGVSLDATDRVARQAEALLSDKTTFPEIKTIFATVSGGGGGFGGGGGSVNIALELVDRSERSRSVWEVQNAIRGIAGTFPDVSLSTNLPSALGGGGSGVSVRLSGPDPAVLSELADQYESLLRHTPGVVEINNSGQAGQPELRATVNRTAMVDLGVTSTTVSQAMRTAIQGSVATQLRADDQNQINVRVMAKRDRNGQPVGLEEIPVLSSRGVLLRLGQVATIESSTGPAQINRSDRNRTVGVSGAVSGRTVGDVARDVRAGQRDIPIPAGYRVTIGGGAQQLDRALTAMISALTLSILLMYMLMAALYESFIYPFIVLLSLPLAMIGALGALWVTGKTLNIFSLIGIIMLTGLVCKNAILLVDYTNTVRKEGKTARQALLIAGPIRLRPIVMTSTTMICSMLPLLLGVGPGGETRSPMAAVVIGGMVTSTLLTLMFVPALYTYFDDLQNLPRRFKSWRRRRVTRQVEQPVLEPEPTAGHAPSLPVPVASAVTLEASH